VKFKREKVSALSGHTEVRYTEINTITDPPTDPFIIRASAGGIVFQGKSPELESRGDLAILAETIDQAWREFLSLKQALKETIMGPSPQMSLFERS
jgi:hypothetical protein